MCSFCQPARTSSRLNVWIRSLDQFVGPLPVPGEAERKQNEQRDPKPPAAFPLEVRFAQHTFERSVRHPAKPSLLAHRATDWIVGPPRKASKCNEGQELGTWNQTSKSGRPKLAPRLLAPSSHHVPADRRPRPNSAPPAASTLPSPPAPRHAAPRHPPTAVGFGTESARAASPSAPAPDQELEWTPHRLRSRSQSLAQFIGQRLRFASPSHREPRFEPSTQTADSPPPRDAAAPRAQTPP